MPLSFKKTAPAVQRCKNQQRRCSYGRDPVGVAGTVDETARCLLDRGAWHDASKDEPPAAGGPVASGGLVKPVLRILKNVAVLAVARPGIASSRVARHLPAVSLAPPDDGELATVFCGLVSKQPALAERRDDVRAVAAAAAAAYARVSSFRKPPALCLFSRVAKGAGLLQKPSTGLELRMGLAREMRREWRDARRTAAGRAEVEAALQAEGLPDTPDRFVVADSNGLFRYADRNEPLPRLKSALAEKRRREIAAEEERMSMTATGQKKLRRAASSTRGVSDDATETGPPSLEAFASHYLANFDDARTAAGLPPSALAPGAPETDHATRISRASRALAVSSIFVLAGPRGAGRRSTVDLACHVLNIRNVVHAPPPPLLDKTDGRSRTVDADGCGLIKPSCSEGVRNNIGEDPDRAWNDTLRKALLSAGSGEPTCVVVADSAWGLSGVTARRLDDVYAARAVGTVAGERVVRPEDEAKIVADFLDQNRPPESPANGGTSQDDRHHADVALDAFRRSVRRNFRVCILCSADDVSETTSAQHPAAAAALKTLLPYATVDVFEDPRDERRRALEASAFRSFGCDGRTKDDVPCPTAWVLRLDDDPRAANRPTLPSLAMRAENASAALERHLSETGGARKIAAAATVAAFRAADATALSCGALRPSPGCGLRAALAACGRTAIFRGEALNAVSRQVYWGLKKMASARAKTDELRDEAKDAHRKARDAFEFSKTSSSFIEACSLGRDATQAKLHKAEAVKTRTGFARERLTKAHLATLGDACLKQLEDALQKLKDAAPRDGSMNGGEVPSAKPIKQILEALAAFLLKEGDDTKPTPEAGWALFTSSDFPETASDYFEKACRAAAKQFPGEDAQALSLKWRKGAGLAERLLADPATGASSVRRMGAAGTSVGVPVSVWIRAGVACWKALNAPSSLAAWAAAYDAVVADDAARDAFDGAADANGAAEAAKRAADENVVDARKASTELEKLSKDLERRHKAALARFGEIKSTLTRWEGRHAALAAAHASLSKDAAAAAVTAVCGAALPLSKRRLFVEAARRACGLPEAALSTTARASSIHVELPAPAPPLCAPVTDEDACDFGGSGDGGIPLRRWASRGLLLGGATGAVALGAVAVETDTWRAPLLCDPDGHGATWLCGAYARARPRGAAALCRVFVDADGGAACVSATPGPGETARPGSAGRTEKGKDGRAPPMIDALRDAMKREPAIVLVELPDACFDGSFLKDLLEPLEPVLRARTDAVSLATAEAPVTRALTMAFSAEAVDGRATAVAHQEKAKFGGARIILRVAASAAAFTRTFGPDANDARHLLSVVDFSPDVPETLAKRFASSAVAYALPNQPRGEIAEEARAKAEAAFRAGRPTARSVRPPNFAKISLRCSGPRPLYDAAHKKEPAPRRLVTAQAAFLAAVAARDDDDGVLKVAEDMDPGVLSSAPPTGGGDGGGAQFKAHAAAYFRTERKFRRSRRPSRGRRARAKKSSDLSSFEVCRAKSAAPARRRGTTRAVRRRKNGTRTMEISCGRPQVRSARHHRRAEALGLRTPRDPSARRRAGRRRASASGRGVAGASGARVRGRRGRGRRRRGPRRLRSSIGPVAARAAGDGLVRRARATVRGALPDVSDRGTRTSHDRRRDARGLGARAASAARARPTRGRAGGVAAEGRRRGDEGARVTRGTNLRGSLGRV